MKRPEKLLWVVKILTGMVVVGWMGWIFYLIINGIYTL